MQINIASVDGHQAKPIDTFQQKQASQTDDIRGKGSTPPYHCRDSSKTLNPHGYWVVHFTYKYLPPDFDGT